MHGHAHEPLGSVAMIFCRLNLNRHRRIVNQALMLPNTSLVPAQPDERSPEVAISATQMLLSGHGDWPWLDGTARMDVCEVLAVWAVRRSKGGSC